MANHVIVGIYAILSAGMAYIFLNKERTDRVRLLRYNGEEIFESKVLNEKHIACICAMVFLFCGTASWRISQGVTDTVNLCRMHVALFGLTGVACVDYREHRIPDFISGMMALIGIALFGVGYVTGQEGIVAYITNAVVTAVAVIMLMLIASVLTGGGIGMGDIKLLASLALLGGTLLLIETVFFSAVYSALAAAGLLLSKQKTLKDAIPYGPFIWAGFLTTVIFFDY